MEHTAEFAWPLGHGLASYDAETAALERGLKALKKVLTEQTWHARPKVLVVTDGLSTLSKLSGRVPRDAREAALCRVTTITAAYCELHFAHVRGHANIAVNEAADLRSDEGRSIQGTIDCGEAADASHKAVVSAVERDLRGKREAALKREAKEHPTVKWYLEVAAESRGKLDATWGDAPRDAMRLVNQMRLGKCPALAVGVPDSHQHTGQWCHECGNVNERGNGEKTDLISHALRVCPYYDAVRPDRLRKLDPRVILARTTEARRLYRFARFASIKSRRRKTPDDPPVLL